MVTSFPRSLGLALLLLVQAIGSAEPTRIIARLLVPVPSDLIGSVAIGGVQCRILSKEPGSTSAAVIVARPVPIERDEDAILTELSSALSSLPQDAKKDVWLCCATGRRVIGTAFSTGWLGAMVPEWTGSKESPTLPSESSATILKLIAQRFVGRGPVRLFWIDSSATWLDGRQTEAHMWSPIERYWEAIGDSGLALYVIVAPGWTSTARSVRYQLGEWNQFSKSLFGERLRVAKQIHGSALIEAWNDSCRATILTVEMPRPRLSVRGKPPELVVFDRNSRQPVFRRLFMAAGNPGTDAASALDQLARSMMRIVPHVQVESAYLTRRCGNLSPTSGESGFLRLEGFDLPIDHRPRA